MKILGMMLVAMLVMVMFSGCSSIETAAFKRKGVLGKVEFATLEAEITHYQVTNNVMVINRTEKYKIEGLKSDLTRALETMDKAIALSKDAAAKSAGVP